MIEAGQGRSSAQTLAQHYGPGKLGTRKKENFPEEARRWSGV